MKSVYQRQFAMMAGLILVSFAVLGGVFATLSYQYTIQEKRSTLENNAAVVAEFTASYRQQGYDIRSRGFGAYIYSLARVSNAHVLLCDQDGSIVYSLDGGGDPHLDGLMGGTISESIIGQVAGTGSYN
ncbi:MAG: sensor histidine kinase, partial [Oscillospiraceae bacterium]